MSDMQQFVARTPLEVGDVLFANKSEWKSMMGEGTA